MEARSQLRHRPTEVTTSDPAEKSGPGRTILAYWVRLVKPRAAPKFIFTTAGQFYESGENGYAECGDRVQEASALLAGSGVGCFAFSACHSHGAGDAFLCRIPRDLRFRTLPVSQLNLLLSQLEQISQTMQVNLLASCESKSGRPIRIPSAGRSRTSNLLRRNLQMALPEIIGQLRASPENIAATFKLYRNLDALYDVFGPVVESAGAFGSKDEFQSVQNDFNELERSRRSLAERMETLASARKKGS